MIRNCRGRACGILCHSLDRLLAIAWRKREGNEQNAASGVYITNISPAESSTSSYISHMCLSKPQNVALCCSVIFSTEPLWATFVSGVFLKETMGPNALIGAAFIFMACLAAQSEQILAMVGKGGGKDTDSSQMMQLEGEAELSHAGSGEDRTEDAFPLSMLDEMEPGAESELELSFDMSLLKEFNVPDGGMHMGGSALEGREAANRSTTKQEGSAVRIGWLASADVSRLE